MGIKWAKKHFKIYLMVSRAEYRTLKQRQKRIGNREAQIDDYKDIFLEGDPRLEQIEACSGGQRIMYVKVIGD